MHIQYVITIIRICEIINIIYSLFYIGMSGYFYEQ